MIGATRLPMVTVALVALVAAVAVSVLASSSAGAGTPVPSGATAVSWGYVNSGQKSPLLVGMPLRRAHSIATHHHITLDVLRVFEAAPKGTVTQEARGLPGPLLLVVSKGQPANLWAVLPRATGPPVNEECAPRFLVDEDGNGSPDICGGDRVNVATWDYFAGRQPPMMSLGRTATKCQVAADYDDDHLNLTWNDSVYEMAKAYYGWTFGKAFTVQLVNAGPYADNCKRLVEPSDG
jgi:hypothetical protein